MIVIDANLLLYAYNTTDVHHAQARAWLSGVLSGSAPVGLAWMSILAFLRIGTDARVFTRPLTLAEATHAVTAWLDQPCALLVEAGDRHFALLQSLLEASQARGPLVMDAHLAALAIEHGATLCTTDRDFSRFPGLRVRNPLTEG